MNNILKLLMVLPLIFGWVNGYAEKKGNLIIDSLMKDLLNSKEDTNKVNLYCDLSFNYYSVNPDEGIKYGLEALELAKKLDWEEGIARAKKIIGINYYIKSNNYKALEYYDDALLIYEKMGKKKDIASVTGNIGLIYKSQNDYPKALAYYFKALKLQEEVGNKGGIAVVCDNIGDIYKATGEYPEALAYYIKAEELDRQIGEKNLIAIVEVAIGEIYGYEKNYKLSIKYLRNAINTLEKIGDKYTDGWAWVNIGKVYLSLYNDSAAAMPVGIASRTALLTDATAYLEHGLKLAKEIDAPEIKQEGYYFLAEAYQINGRYKQSFNCYTHYYNIKDSIFLKDNNKKIVTMEYEHKLVADSIKIAQEKKIADMKQRQWSNYKFAGIALIALLAGFSVYIINEKGKSEKLLLNILPREVATELKAKGVIEARQFDNATVLLTTFATFVNAGETFEAQQLVDELDTCFKAFDAIISNYKIEKVKTTGYSYLAVSGLPLADPQHAENIVNGAIEINKYMQERLAKMGNKTFELRIGIHTGSVVAGIVGVKKFAYDIWGDTVNTAARMEQNSAPGKINISQTTYQLVKDKFTCAYRGEVDVKNKGYMKMYFVG